MVPIENGEIVFSDKVHLPLSPMIGTIATCPAEESVFSWKQGPYGGNMDCQFIAPGASVYLPVFVDGGLLLVGDCHARQGDGEIGPPFEISATIRLTIDVLKGHSELMSWPRVVTSSHYITVVSGRTFEVAAEEAMREMILWLEELFGLGRRESFFLLAQTADVRAAQIANTLHTAYCSTPREFLPDTPI